MSRGFLLAAVNESPLPIGYLGLGGEVAALSDFVLAGVQIQPLVLQNLATYSTVQFGDEYERDDRDEMIKIMQMQR
jgi:hypothetical protein